VDGVYDKDPMAHDDAMRFDKLTYLDVLQKGLRVMDSTAVSLCMENNLPIIVFRLQAGSVADVIQGRAIGTHVTH